MNKINFVKELESRGIDCSQEQVNLLWKFMNHVLETNEKFNLTAIKDEETFVEKMIFDSALLLNNQKFEGETIIDIGAGAGFPSVVISILSPKTHIIAIDSTAKKVTFIQEFAKENKLNIEVICARAEEYAQAHRDSCLLVTARAVASLRVLIELSMPMLQAGGHLIAMKGPGLKEEIAEASGTFKKLKC